MTLRSMRRLYATLIVAVFVFSLTILAGVQPAVAQSTGSATLRGTVKDPQGAVIRDATVTLVNDRTKDERQTKTSEDGTYTFTALSPGAYTLKVEIQGFKTSVKSDLMIETSGTQGIDLTTITGSGPGGRIVRADLGKAAGGIATAPAAQPSAGRR